MSHQKNTAQLEVQELKLLRNKKRVSKSKNNIQLLLMALPVIVYLFIFHYLPMGGAIIAFKDYRYDKGILGSEWVGFKNFEFFFKSSDAITVTLNTLGYNFAFIVFGTIASVTIALILNEVKNKAAIKLYQTAMFIPHFMSWVVVAFIVYGFLSPGYGIINQILTFFGKETVNFYGNPDAWPGIMVFTGLWKYVGFGVLINYAVLISIDKAFYEAAAIDGATKLKSILHISIPFLIPITLIQFILSVGRIFYSDFGLFYQLPQNAAILYRTTQVIDTYVFRALMQYNDIGMASSVGLFQSVVGLILVVGTNKIVKSINSEGAMF